MHQGETLDPLLLMRSTSLQNGFQDIISGDKMLPTNDEVVMVDIKMPEALLNAKPFTLTACEALMEARWYVGATPSILAIILT